MIIIQTLRSLVPAQSPAAHAKPTQGTALVNRRAQNQLNRTSAPATTLRQMDHFALSPPHRYQIAFLCIIPDCKMGVRGNRIPPNAFATPAVGSVSYSFGTARNRITHY
jgi:hypothetical protein